jgi:hypothetical protein
VTALALHPRFVGQSRSNLDAGPDLDLEERQFHVQEHQNAGELRAAGH